MATIAMNALCYCFLLTLQLNLINSDIAGDWKVQFNDGQQKLELYSRSSVNVSLHIFDVNLSETNANFNFKVQTADNKLAKCEQTIEGKDLQLASNGLGEWQGLVLLQGVHFGYTHMYVSVQSNGNETERALEQLSVTVLRDEKIDNRIFTYTSAVVVLLMFINLGTVLDLQRLRAILLIPIGPIIGFSTQYIILPTLALGLGYLYFSDNKPLQLGLFLTALSPSGGLANICIVFLKGNINLSIATTTVNSIMALAMLPFWIFVLARVVYEESTLSVPFANLGVGAAAVVVSITIGVMLRLCFPKATRLIFKFLKPLSVFLSLCLIGLTVGMNAFIFKELNLMIFLAAITLPLLGYIVCFVLSKLCCRSNTDSLTIGIETSVLNMSFAIVMLQYSLEEPKSDMATVVPIISALMSLCLVLIFYFVRRVMGWNKNVDADAFDERNLLVEKDAQNL